MKQKIKKIRMKVLRSIKSITVRDSIKNNSTSEQRHVQNITKRIKKDRIHWKELYGTRSVGRSLDR